jgi:hypothetical protein
MVLYHYTTLDVLALILKNKTLRFNSLVNVDDQEEATTFDYGSFQEHIFVSCWTEDKEENIALWNMYAKNMHGIRIGIDPKNIKFIPKEKIMVPLYHIVANVKPENEKSAFIIWYQNRGIWDNKIKVKYDLEKKYDFVIHKSEIEIHYNFEDLACRKRKEWSFQKEVRFVLFGTSIENKKNEFNHQYIINSIVAKEPFSCNYVDLLLGNTFFNNIEILLGPLTSESDKIICESLLEYYIGENNYKLQKSRLNIRKNKM